MSVELLPCPFCGAKDGRLVQAFTRATDDFAFWSVECLDCGCEIADDESQERADGAWNTRATPSTGDQPSQVAGEGSLSYRVSWPRPATLCDLVPLWKGEFRDHGDWVSFATTRLTGTNNGRSEVKAICVDALGRRCHDGGDFARARDEGAFPVRYFWECLPAATLRTPDADAIRVEAARYRWLRDGNAYVPEEENVRGGDQLDALCDEAIRALATRQTDEGAKR